MMTTWTWALPRASLSQANVRWAKWICQPVAIEQFTPHQRNLLALRNRVGRDKTDFDARIRDVLGGTFEPPHHIVNVTDIVEVGQDFG